MKSKKFIKEVENIHYLITQYGINNCKFEVKLNQMKESEFEEFISSVHIGFMKAQNLIIHNLLTLIIDHKKKKQLLKELRVNRESKSKIDSINHDLKYIEYQIIIFKKLADSILWQLVQHDDTILKRIYHKNPYVDITNSNLEFDLKIIEDIFEHDKMKFPLLTDITSIAQVGDLFFIDYRSKKIGIIELKDGKINDEIEAIINDFSQSKCPRQLHFNLQNRNDNFMNQFERYIKQQSRLHNTIKTINTGKGIDYGTGLNVVTPEKIIEVKYFDEHIKDMLVDVQKKNYSIKVIDDCLFVGVYSRKNKPIDNMFELWIKSCNIDFPVVNYRGSFWNPIVQPVFIKAFSSKDILKIVSGEVCIKMSLDIERWLEKLNESGVSYEWLSKKRTSRLKNKIAGMNPLMYKEQALEIQYNNRKVVLYDGLYGKIFYNFIKPSSIINYLKATTEID